MALEDAGALSVHMENDNVNPTVLLGPFVDFPPWLPEEFHYHLDELRSKLRRYRFDPSGVNS